MHLRVRRFIPSLLEMKRWLGSNDRETVMLTTYLFSWICLLSSCSQDGQVHEASRGADAGLHRITVYWLAQEKRNDRYRRRRSVRLIHRKTGRLLARVSRRFAKDLLMQGTGKLYHRGLIQYAGRCGRKSRMRCMKVRRLNRRKYPMSVGAMGRALIPFRSLAVDSRKIPLGSSVYIPLLGKILRKKGYKHNGCFVAHDRGGRIRGSKIDLFVGWPRWFKRRLGKRMPRYARVYLRHPHCRKKKRRRSRRIWTAQRESKRNGRQGEAN
ncbi:MAG: hypothetical protein EP343_28210 [Deltaproteobacteria bacterium]|nr:MAG: hypothetical protein EP343_28210 [Deltaproteobacteria bacterium]